MLFCFSISVFVFALFLFFIELINSRFFIFFFLSSIVFLTFNRPINNKTINRKAKTNEIKTIFHSSLFLLSLFISCNFIYFIFICLSPPTIIVFFFIFFVKFLNYLKNWPINNSKPTTIVNWIVNLFVLRLSGRK